jgi:ElaB/YqjD/DUF883 family membrane-anchored ribosome-binding protein
LNFGRSTSDRRTRRQETIMTKSASHASHPDDIDPIGVEDVLDDLRAVVRDAESLLKEGQVGERVAEVRERIEEKLDDARERLHEMGNGKAARVKSAARSADTYVRDNPWAAVAVAAGVGFLIGSLGRRR